MQKHGVIRLFRRYIGNRKNNNRHHAVSSNGGYTLIELMVALLILAVGVLGIWGMQGTAIRSNTTARRITDTAALGSDQFEKLMLLTYNDAVLTPGTTTTRAEDTYTVTWDVSAAGTPFTNVKTVTVTASWVESGQQRSVSYVYYKADQI